VIVRVIYEIRDDVLVVRRSSGRQRCREGGWPGDGLRGVGVEPAVRRVVRVEGQSEEAALVEGARAEKAERDKKAKKAEQKPERYECEWTGILNCNPYP